MIFTFGGGQVYVNTKPVGKTGKTKRKSDGLYVKDSLQQVIRPVLKTGGYTPAPRPSPSRVSGCVVVDAGHGGKDPGATSCLGYHEKSVNLQVAHKVASLLKRRGVEVVMTRTNDTFIELEERAAVANRRNADLFVSIHADSTANKSVRGFTIYVARSASWSSQKAASAISRSMSEVAANGRGIQRADYRVLVNTRGPAVLVELGYLSNGQEASLLRNSTHQNRLASAIAAGIMSFL
jgi:N-acetylmuramoyl-L-alanine amidase